jgi:hypothetical protein
VKDEALKLALEALEGIHPGNMTPMAEEYWNKAITAIKQAKFDAVHEALEKEAGIHISQQPAPVQKGAIGAEYQKSPWDEKGISMPPPAAPVQDSTCSETLRAQGKAYPRTCRKCGLGPCIALANIALDKKAENARELGLDYEPALKDNSNYRYDPPVAEPVAWLYSQGAAKVVSMNYVPGVRATPLYTTPPEATVQEPVAWIHVDAYQPSNRHLEWKENCKGYEGDWVKHPLYTTPPAAQRQWVGLTDEEIEKACVPLGAAMLSFTEVARAIEAKLKEKNT